MIEIQFVLMKSKDDSGGEPQGKTYQVEHIPRRGDIIAGISFPKRGSHGKVKDVVWSWPNGPVQIYLYPVSS